jgi:uncharacterized membrane protein YccC
MSISNDYLTQLRTLHTNVTESYNRLNRMQSETDREVATISHDIETKDLDETAIYDAAKQLQEALRKRRAIKQEFARIQPLYKALELCVEEVDKCERRRAAKFKPETTEEVFTNEETHA